MNAIKERGRNYVADERSAEPGHVTLSLSPSSKLSADSVAI